MSDDGLCANVESNSDTVQRIVGCRTKETGMLAVGDNNQKILLLRHGESSCTSVMDWSRWSIIIRRRMQGQLIQRIRLPTARMKNPLAMAAHRRRPEDRCTGR